MARIFSFLLLSVLAISVNAQISISTARSYNEGNTVTISGIVTNGSELGTIRYIQDATAGIALYDGSLENIKRGDSITVTGVLSDYSNLLEVVNVSNPIIHSSENQLPDAKEISVAQIGEDYEGELVLIKNVIFSNQGSTFGSNQNYSFSVNGQASVVRIMSDSPLVGQTIPTGEISLQAICSQYSTSNNDTQNGYQLIPRDLDDIFSDASFSFTSPVEVGGITQNSIELYWTTDGGATPFVRYGSSNNESALTNYKAGDSTTSDESILHLVEITGLQPAEIVYAQVFNVSENDTVFSAIQTCITESNSSGEMRVYFNSEIDESVAEETIANYIGDNIEDTLAYFINQAEQSIDIAIYNFNNSTVSNALNSAVSRGVKIRLITCGSTSHYSVDDLTSDIEVLERPYVSGEGIMHNKFMVFDVEDADNCWVWGGSTNLTQDQLNIDANNILFVQDQSLAKAYQLEFEEMWGGTGDEPNSGNAKFGADKTDNTPHEFLIGGNRVECYFSPSDNTNQRLIDAMETADNDLSVETMLITRTELAEAITDAYDRGANVHVITNEEEDNDDYVNSMLSSSLPTGKYIFDDDATGMLHHKLAIIDVNNEDFDPQVINGSHNWSMSANERNDENTLIIHDADIANQFYQQFAYRFKQNNGEFVVAVEEIEKNDVRVFPNPTAGQINISASVQIRNVQIFSVSGALLLDKNCESLFSAEINMEDFKPGIYLLKLEFKDSTINTYKIFKR